MSVPYFRFYPTDYDADTSHLSIIEDGAYSRLLRVCWLTPGCSIPDDEAWIFRRLRVRSDDDKSAVRAVLGEFFQRADGRIFNDRLAREFSQSVERHELASGNGKKSAAKKAALKTNDFNSTNQNQNQNHKEEDTNVSLSSGDDVQPINDIAIAVSAYNASAETAGWPKVQVLSKQRRSNLKARLKECGGLDGWIAALGKAKASPHCCGQNERGWTANFDFLTRQSSFAKLMEGNYDDRAPARKDHRATSRTDALRDQLHVAGTMRRTSQPNWL